MLGELSYEHIPPAAAFNNKSTRVYRGAHALKKSYGLLGDSESLSSEELQRGSGAYTLCIKCNSFTGSKYAVEFVKACRQAASAKCLDGDRKFNGIDIGFSRINPLKFAKQVIAMFASINRPEFFDDQHELRRLVLNELEYGIDVSKYGLFMYLHHSTVAYNVGLSTQVMLDGSAIRLSRLTTTPFGFVLVLDPERQRMPVFGTEITDLLNDYEPDSVGSLFLKLPIRRSNSPF